MQKNKNLSVIQGFIFCVSEDPENARPLVTFLSKSPPFNTTVCVCVCGLREFTCLFVYCATACPSRSHRSAK